MLTQSVTNRNAQAESNHQGDKTLDKDNSLIYMK